MKEMRLVCLIQQTSMNLGSNELQVRKMCLYPFIPVFHVELYGIVRLWSASSRFLSLEMPPLHYYCVIIVPLMVINVKDCIYPFSLLCKIL